MTKKNRCKQINDPESHWYIPDPPFMGKDYEMDFTYGEKYYGNLCTSNIVQPTTDQLYQCADPVPQSENGQNVVNQTTTTNTTEPYVEPVIPGTPTHQTTTPGNPFVTPNRNLELPNDFLSNSEISSPTNVEHTILTEPKDKNMDSIEKIPLENLEANYNNNVPLNSNFANEPVLKKPRCEINDCAIYAILNAVAQNSLQIQRLQMENMCQKTTPLCPKQCDKKCQCCLTSCSPKQQEQKECNCKESTHDESPSSTETDVQPSSPIKGENCEDDDDDEVKVNWNLENPSHTGIDRMDDEDLLQTITEEEISDIDDEEVDFPLQNLSENILPNDLTEDEEEEDIFDTLIDPKKPKDKIDDTDPKCIVDKTFPKPGIRQYTPSFTLHTRSAVDEINSSTKTSMAKKGLVTSQDPDGYHPVNKTKTWDKVKWDGVPFDPYGKTKEEMSAFLNPTGDLWLIRGLREKFYEVNPFKDNKNPTVAEIDAWNIHVIQHFRELFGNPTPVRNNAKLYLESRWADERKHTTVWDNNYQEGKFDGATGPCNHVKSKTNNGHCGDGFFPNPDDRAKAIAAPPYNNNFEEYPELENYPCKYSQSAGIFSCPNYMPWSLKLGQIICDMVKKEGIEGHPGPFLNWKGPFKGASRPRDEFGCAWLVAGDYINFRGKWR